MRLASLPLVLLMLPVLVACDREAFLRKFIPEP